MYSLLMRIRGSRSLSPTAPGQKTNVSQKAGLSLALVGVLALTGCGSSGPNAPTRLIQKVTDGAEATSGSITIRDLLLVAQPDASATLVGTIINEANTEDSLVGITVNGIPAELDPTSLPLLQNEPVIFAGDSANATGTVPGLNITAGNRVEVVVTFAQAEPITLSAMVREKSDYFAHVGDPSTTPAPTSVTATP
jgi:hypothetical protein